MRLGWILAGWWWATMAFAAPVRLAHQGRLLASDGVPVSGPTSVTVRLYDGASGPEIWVKTYAVSVEDGFFSLSLEGTDDASRPLDSSLFFGRDVYASVSTSALTGPRTHLATVPRAAVADAVDGRVRLATSSATTCASTDAGTLVWNTASSQVRVCDGANYVALAGASEPNTGILDTGGVRKWADGGIAANCSVYRTPSDGHTYTGDTGSGLYWIDPDGPTGSAAYVNYCDQTTNGGGWTLVWKTQHRQAVSSNGPGNTSFSACNVDPFVPANFDALCNIPSKWTTFLPTDVRLVAISDLTPAVDYDYIFTEPSATLQNSDNILHSTNASHYVQVVDNCLASIGAFPSTVGVSSGYWTVKHGSRAGCCADTDLRNSRFDANCARHGCGGPGCNGNATTVMFLR
jgi:hypothetical protein